MINYNGGGNFKALYHDFISEDVTGKIFMMESYITESMEIGAGATIYLNEAEPFLLYILMDWFVDKKYGVIGDLVGFFKIVHEHQYGYIKNKIVKSKIEFERTYNRMFQLHNILRKQQTINSSNKAMLSEK